MSIGHFLGRRAADVVHFFRGRQTMPCTVDWDTQGNLFNPAIIARIQENHDLVMDDEPCCGMCDNGCWDE